MNHSIWLSFTILMMCSILAIPSFSKGQSDFKVLSTSPGGGESGVSPKTDILIAFSNAVDADNLSKNNFIIMNTEDQDFFEGEVAYDNATKEITVSDLREKGESGGHSGGEEKRGLHSGAHIEVRIINIVDVDGNELIGSNGITGGDHVFRFRVKEKKEKGPGFGTIPALIAIVVGIGSAGAGAFGRRR